MRQERGPRGLRVWNDAVELVASTDYGPRILECSLLGGENVLGFVPPAELSVETPFGEPWHIYGGHRLWRAPEDPVWSYVPDNAPVHAEVDGRTLVLTPPPERESGLEKQLRITLADKGALARIEHRISNRGERDVELAVWGLSLMARGGTALIPAAPFAPHPQALLPVRRLVTWPYTSLADPRFRFGSRFTRVTHDPSARSPQKIGVWDGDVGWVAYALGETLFVKRYPTARADERHADLGCNVEVFTDRSFLELETLSPLVKVAPGATAAHVETWELFSGVSVPDDDEQAEVMLATLLAR